MNEDEYKLVKYSVQLKEVELNELICKKLDGDSKNLHLSVQPTTELLSDNLVNVYLKVRVGFRENDSGPFEIDLTYKGVCHSHGDYTGQQLENAAYDLAPALLLPYARECVSNLMSKMNLPVFYLPTIDVLQTISENQE